MQHVARLCILLLYAGAGMLVCGCGSSEPPPPELPPLVPVTGAVTANGKPLEGAMLIFTPDTTGGFPAHGITDVNGNYSMATRSGTGSVPGCAPGTYRVMVSRFLKPDGTPPLDPNEPPAMSGAMESLPPQYSSPTSSSLRAVVAADGGEFKFDLKVKK